MHYSWTCRTHVGKQGRSEITWSFTSQNLLRTPRQICARMHLYSTKYGNLVRVVEHALRTYGKDVFSLKKFKQMFSLS